MFLRFESVFLSRKSGNQMMGVKVEFLIKSRIFWHRRNFDGTWVCFWCSTWIWPRDVWWFKYFVECGFEKVDWCLFWTWYFKIHLISFCLGSWRCSRTCMDSENVIGDVYKIGFRFILGKKQWRWDFCPVILKVRECL